MGPARSATPSEHTDLLRRSPPRPVATDVVRLLVEEAIVCRRLAIINLSNGYNLSGPGVNDSAVAAWAHYIGRARPEEADALTLRSEASSVRVAGERRIQDIEIVGAGTICATRGQR